MPWRQTLTEKLTDVLRFIVRGALLINCILASLASVYFVAKFLWWTVRWFDKKIFAAPWCRR